MRVKSKPHLHERRRRSFIKGIPGYVSLYERAAESPNRDTSLQPTRSGKGRNPPTGRLGIFHSSL
jgi:hypothetical protein